MIIVNIIGGLGNQMFQYAFGYAVSKKNNQKLKLDINDFDNYDLRDYELELFNIKVNKTTKQEVLNLKYKKPYILFKILKKLFKKEIPLSSNFLSEKSDFIFDRSVFEVKNNIYFSGYWQSEKYFKEYRDDLLKQFTLKNDTHPETQKYQQKINSSNSVSLHIRRGDYITNAKTNSVHGVCDLGYYKKAVLKMLEQIDEPHFFIFSDGLTWAKDNLNFIENKIFVELSKEIPDHEEMYLMSLCKYNIIANSSFSWWGAWLNQNQDKMVIAPKKWVNDLSRDTKDLIPNTWIRL